MHIVPRGGKKSFMFFNTSSNTDFWKHRLFGFQPPPQKKQTLSHFMFYVVLNIAFQRETKVHMESSFGYFFFKKQDFPILNKIQ